MRSAEALYAVLLLLYPEVFRDGVGASLLRDFRAGLAGRRSLLARGSFAVRELADLLRNLPGVWWAARSHGDHTRGEGAMDGTRQDVVYAVRSLRARPAFAAVVVLTLGLGIGASAAVFGVIDAVLIEPLPYPDADELVYMYESYQGDQTRSVSYLNFQDWRVRNRSFRDVAARTAWFFTLTGAGDAEVLGGMIVSAGLLPLLGVEPQLGRLFTDEEEAREDRVVLLGAGLWERRFGSDPTVVGRTLTLNDEPWTVVGVLPRGLEFPVQADVYAPLTTLSDGDLYARGSRPGISVIARLRPGLGIEGAQLDMDGIAAALAAEYPEADADAGVVVRSLRERYLGSARPVLVPLAGAVALVFLIACANVANLLLVRGQSRRREAALRSALGGRRGRIARTYLAEAGMLSAAGAILGLAVAEGGIALLRQWTTTGVPRLASAEVDTTVLLFTMAIAGLATLLVGALPALRLSSVQPARELVDGGARGGTLAGGRLRSGLVVAEVGLSFVLLTASGLMVRSMVNLGGVDPSFDAEGVLTVGIPVPETRYPTPMERARFVDELTDRVAALPGVVAVGGGDPLPLAGNNRQMRTVAEEPNAVGGEGLRTDWYSVTPSYFATMRIPFLEGGAFEGRDRDVAAPVVVDRLFAERYWPGESALGRRVRFVGDWSPWLTVVGVAEHVTHYGPRTEGREQIYVPHWVRTWGQNLVIRSERSPASLATEVRAIVTELDPLVPVRGVATMESLVEGAVASERLATRALALFGAAALALAMLGLYGLVSYSVSLRSREIGIRMALGARRDAMVRRIVGRGVALAGLGLGLGVVGALAATRLLEALLYDVDPADPATLAASGLLLLTVSALAAIAPALRASRLDPVRTLRAEG